MSEPRIREANLALDAIDDIEFCPCGFVFERVRFQHWISMGEE